jgi:DNA-binding MarR family transcriptional regulator
MRVTEPEPPINLKELLKDLLAQDLTLSPTDRRVLEILLLHPSPTTARSLSQSAGTNLQALYGSLDRLSARGLVDAVPASSPARFQVAHPSVTLRSLLEPGRRAAQIAAAIEGPLRERFEEQAPVPEGAREEPRARSTPSRTAASSWLIGRIGSTSGEVWFLGDESPWFATGSPLESEIERRTALALLRVRMLVRPLTRGDPRSSLHARMRRFGVGVRYSNRFTAPTAIVHRRWLITVGSEPARGPPVYVELDAPELCKDLLAVGEEVWASQPGDVAAPRTPETLRTERPWGVPQEPDSATPLRRSTGSRRIPLPNAARSSPNGLVDVAPALLKSRDRAG